MLILTWIVFAIALFLSLTLFIKVVNHFRLSMLLASPTTSVGQILPVAYDLHMLLVSISWAGFGILISC